MEKEQKKNTTPNKQNDIIKTTPVFLFTGKTERKKNERTGTDSYQKLKNCSQYQNTENSMNYLLTTNDLTKISKPHFKIMFKQHIILSELTSYEGKRSDGGKREIKREAPTELDLGLSKKDQTNFLHKPKLFGLRHTVLFKLFSFFLIFNFFLNYIFLSCLLRL